MYLLVFCIQFAIWNLMYLYMLLPQNRWRIVQERENFCPNSACTSTLFIPQRVHLNSAFRLCRAFSEGQHEAVCHCVNDQNLPLDFIILHNNSNYWKLETQKDLFKWLYSPLYFQIIEIHGYVHDKEVLYRCIYYCYLYMYPQEKTPVLPVQ